MEKVGQARVTKKVTLNLGELHTEALDRITSDLGVTTTEYMRRLIGLGSVIHSLIDESGDNQVRLAVADENGEITHRHIVNDILF